MRSSVSGTAHFNPPCAPSGAVISRVHSAWLAILMETESWTYWWPIPSLGRRLHSETEMELFRASSTSRGLARFSGSNWETSTATASSTWQPSKLSISEGLCFSFIQEMDDVSAPIQTADTNDIVPQGSLDDMAIGDFDRDGKLDIAVVSEFGVITFRGNGDGTFQSPLTSGVAANAYGLKAADMNGDEILDLIAGVPGESQENLPAEIEVFLGNGDGTFRSGLVAPLPSDFRTMGIGDINGDGKLDVVTSDASASSFSILLGNGDGTMQNAIAYPADVMSGNFGFGDFNADGKIDLAMLTADGTDLAILLQGVLGLRIPGRIGLGYG